MVGKFRSSASRLLFVAGVPDEVVEEAGRAEVDRAEGPVGARQVVGDDDALRAHRESHVRVRLVRWRSSRS